MNMGTMSPCVQKSHIQILCSSSKVYRSFHSKSMRDWFQAKSALMKMMKCVNWIFMKHCPCELHISFIILMSLCQTITHSVRFLFPTHTLPPSLTLCAWLAVPFTLIKAGIVRTLPLAPFAHSPLPSALITKDCVLLIGVISSSDWTTSPCSLTAIYEKSAGETEAIAFDGHTFIEYHNAVTKR